MPRVKKAKQYILMSNFKPEFENGEPVLITEGSSRYQILSSLSSVGNKPIIVDDRENIVSIHTDTENTWEWYINYMDFIAKSANMIRYAAYSSSSGDNYINRALVKQCNNGYIPLVMLPTSMHTKYEQRLVGIIENMGLPYITIPSMSFNHSTHLATKDTWVHKFDIAKYLNIKPEEVHVVDTLRRILC